MAASCASLIGLGDYASAAAKLCEKLIACDGADRYPGCESWLAGQLESATAADRSGWLTHFADAACTESCANARLCLDVIPLCGDSGESCGQTEHCCGFIVGKAKCEDEETSVCCKPKGSDCEQDRECCGGDKCEAISPTERTCGRTKCFEVGQACASSGECCSQNCDGNGFCSVVCLEPNAACSKPEDCCSKQCDDSGHCGCAEDGDDCGTPDECCSKVCNNGKCESSKMCFPSGEGCELTSECCPPNECEGQHCCAPNGETCDGADQCCNGVCEDKLCCSNIGGSCNTESECCQGVCIAGTCKCADLGQECAETIDCCDAATSACYLNVCSPCVKPKCHGLCKPGEPLPDSQSGNIICVGGTLVKDCAKAVCKELPHCCCTAWDMACINLVNELSACGDLTCNSSDQLP